MLNKKIGVLLCLLGFVHGTPSSGHGLPIYISVDSSTNQVVTSAGFDAGLLLTHPTFGLSTDLPGLGVLGLSDGVHVGDQIGLRVTQGLLYWNGTELAPTAATFTVNSAETVESYTVTEQTGLQSGMTWATYPNSPVPFWDADGLFQLSGGAQGIYGLVVQILVDKVSTSVDPIASEPFVIPFVYGNWTGQEAEALDVLKSAIILPSAADFNRDWSVDADDLAIWQVAYGLSQGAAQVAGDTDADGDVDGIDFLQWQRDFEQQPTAVALNIVPEPTGIAVCFAAFVVMVFIRF